MDESTYGRLLEKDVQRLQDEVQVLRGAVDMYAHCLIELHSLGKINLMNLGMGHLINWYGDIDDKDYPYEEKE